jgi:pimeloyl-CoA synthetase
MDELEMQKLLEELDEEEKEEQEKLLKEIEDMKLSEEEKKFFDQLIATETDKLQAIKNAVEIVKNRRACGDKRF